MVGAALGFAGRASQGLALRSLDRVGEGLMLFTFARVSGTFIVLRGHELGMSVVELLLLWAALNLAKALTSMRGVALVDKLGKERLILFGWAAFGVSFLLLGWVTQPPTEINDAVPDV